jgi:hypothetical protein
MLCSESEHTILNLLSSMWRCRDRFQRAVREHRGLVGLGECGYDEAMDEEHYVCMTCQMSSREPGVCPSCGCGKPADGAVQQR